MSDREHQGFEAIYDDLRDVAGAYMRRQGPEHTLSPTALVHEAYMKMERAGACLPEERAHALAYAAKAMRQILVDHARRKNRQRRGGCAERFTLMSRDLGVDQQEIDLLALDEALTRLAETSERDARIVELRYFGGLTSEQVAEVMGIARSTVAEGWAFARAWLRRELA